MTSAKREFPNVLLIITDQQRADHLGCYGNPILRTPNIDRLAAQGRHYSHCYVANPICMPNRASLMTGRMPSVHGVRHNGIPLSHDHTTFVELLAAAGYQTALVGKSHLQNFGHDGPHRLRYRNETGLLDPPAELRDAIKDHRDGGRYDNEWTPFWEANPNHRVSLPFYGFQDVTLCTYHGDSVGADYARWLQKVAPEHAAARGAEHARVDPRYIAPQAWRTNVPEEFYPTAFIRDRTIEKLQRFNSTGKPWMLQCSFTDPHHPFSPPGRYWDMYDPRDIPLPPSFGSTRVPAVVERFKQNVQGLSRTGVIPFTVNERECREMIALTYGMISMIDDAVGEIMTELRRLGADDNTLVIFTSDHGDWMGEHSLMLKGPYHYQGLIRTPLVWRDPDEMEAGRCDDALLSTIDIPASILDRCGLAPYHGLQGRAVANGAPGRAAVMIENDTQMLRGAAGILPRVRTLITADCWRLSLYGHLTTGEMYDLKSDPGEMQDLFENPDFEKRRAQLIEMMMFETIALQDISPLPTAQA